MAEDGAKSPSAKKEDPTTTPMDISEFFRRVGEDMQELLRPAKPIGLPKWQEQISSMADRLGVPQTVRREDTEAGDPVNHPKHYTSHPSGVECIEITRHMNFNLGNVVKYIWRSGLKGEDISVQDLEKAQWYLNDEIKRRKTEDAIISSKI